MKLFKVFDDIKNSKFIGDIRDQLKEEFAGSAIDMQELKEELANVKKGLQEKWESQEVQDSIKGMKSDFKKQLEAIRDGTFLEDGDSEDTQSTSTYGETTKTRRSSSTEGYSLQEEMNKLVGLSRVKEALVKFEAYANYKKKAAANNISVPSSNMHMLFLGNPGTGKTVVARKMAKFLYISGIIQEEKVVEVSRKDLVGGYIGQTAITTNEKIQEAMGGILFVDEAYTLYSESSEDYGKEAVETIMKAMEDHKDRLIVIFAGYERDMRKFVSMNDGISSRIGFTFIFDDYSPEELVKMFVLKMTANNYKVDEGCYPKLLSLFETHCRRPNFGNGRFVDKVIQQTIMQKAMNASAEIGTIVVEDIPDSISEF